jgi:hypothetical protein
LSRLASSRGSGSGPTPTVRAGAAAPRRPGILVQSPKSDIYVVMLAIALGCIVLGCLLLAMLFGGYGFSTKVSSAASQYQTASLA